MRARYGASPLHLLAHLAVLPLVAWALLQVIDRPDAIRILLWLALSAVVHDFVLLPFYSVLDRAGQRRHDEPRRIAVVGRQVGAVDLQR